MRITIVANKWWEVSPLVAVLQHVSTRQPDASASPNELRDAYQLGMGSSSIYGPRTIVRVGNANIEIWCIQDLMDPAENSSLTWEKARVLKRVVRDPKEEQIVIAFGTAANPLGSGKNGNVVIGTSVFVHDPYVTPPDPKKHWSHPLLNQLVTSSAASVVDQLPRNFVKEAERRFLVAPNGSACPPRVHLDSALVSLGVVNVTSSADYKWTDKQAYDKFKKVIGSGQAESLETTHGVVRLVLDMPFIYVSGIANAMGAFAEEVRPNPYSQSFVAAHNAAIALAWLIPELSGPIAEP